VRAERRRRARGFTLIEVLAALVIVALGMLGVIEAVTQTARNGSYLRDKTLAHWVAMNLIAERRIEQSPPDVAESSDEVELAGQRWRWSMKVTQTDVQTLRRMDVSVRRADAPEGSSLASVTGFYGTALRVGSPVPVAWDGSGTPGSNDGADDQDDKGGDGQPTDDAGDGDENPDEIPGGGDNPQPDDPPDEEETQPGE
jgi:general secretion pathway protein I